MTLTIGDIQKECAETLLKAGIEESRFEARLIIAHALEISPEQVFAYPEKKLGADQAQRIQSLTARRAGREPLALITGEKEFWSLSFRVSPATLIPRPDSETLIEAVLAAYPDRNADLRILDLGTGSGCLLLTLLHEYKKATGVGVDCSHDALSVARANGKNLNLAERAQFVAADWNDGLSDLGVFDLIVCNPPYIPEGDKKSLQPEVVGYEPHGALFAGADGLSQYRVVVSLLPDLIGREAGVFFETGINQADCVVEMMAGAGMENISVCRDLAGIERCVVGFL